MIDLDLFKENYVFRCTVTWDKNIFENIRCELNVNELDINSMGATLTEFDSSLESILRAMDSNSLIRIKSENYPHEIELEGRLKSFSIGGDGAKVLTNVNLYSFVTNIKDGNISNYHFLFYLPKLETFSFPKFITRHFSRGYLVGWRALFEEKSSEEWEDNKYDFITEKGVLTFIPGYLFKEINLGDKFEKAPILINQLYTSITVDSRNEALNCVKSSIECILNAYLRIIALYESHFVNWYRLIITAFNEKDELIFKKEIIKRVPDNPKTNLYRKRLINYDKSLIDYLPELVSNYNKLNNKLRLQYDSILDRYIIACSQKMVDTKLIYIHSCLDLICKFVGSSGKSLNHKVINACKKTNLDWIDLFPYMTEQSLVDKGEFILNKVRNDILHYGTYPQDYNIVVKEIDKTIALTERFLFSFLNFDYKKIGFGYTIV